MGKSKVAKFRKVNDSAEVEQIIFKRLVHIEIEKAKESVYPLYRNSVHSMKSTKRELSMTTWK